MDAYEGPYGEAVNRIVQFRVLAMTRVSIQ